MELSTQLADHIYRPETLAHLNLWDYVRLSRKTISRAPCKSTNDLHTDDEDRALPSDDMDVDVDDPSTPDADVHRTTNLHVFMSGPPNDRDAESAFCQTNRHMCQFQ